MKEIYDLYEKCANYMSGDDTNTAKEIIEQAVDVLADNKELNELWSRCVVHINNWNGNSIEQQESDAYEIVEELSGELGEYLDC